MKLLNTAKKITTAAALVAALLAGTAPKAAAQCPYTVGPLGRYIAPAIVQGMTATDDGAVEVWCTDALDGDDWFFTVDAKTDLRIYDRVKVVALDIVKDIAHKLPLHHLCNSRKFHIQTTFLITANGAYPGNCSSADFSAASPASRSVSASNSCPMMMHGAVTPAPFQPATLI